MIYEALKKSLEQYIRYNEASGKEKLVIEKELRSALLGLREALDDIKLGYQTPEEKKAISKKKKKVVDKEDWIMYNHRVVK